MKFEYLHPADQLVMIMNRIYYGDMTTMSGGNISVLDSDGDIWITPSSIDKGNLTRNDICQVKPDGTVIGRHKPSVELPFHKLVYKTRPDARAVVHAHPPALVSYSLTRTAPNTELLPAPNSVIGKVGIAKYEVPGSIKLGENIAEIFDKGCNAVMMDNHGVVTCGENLSIAFKRFETMEHCAEINIAARKIGTPKALKKEQFDLFEKKSKEVSLKEFNVENRTSEEKEVRFKMCDLLHRAYRKKLVTSTQGTFSQRLKEKDSFLITPEGEDRLYIEPEDLVRVDGGRCEAGKKPDASVLLHKMIYDMHPDVKAIVIAAPSNVMAFGTTGLELDARTIPESYIMMRTISYAPFETRYNDYKKISEMISESAPLVLALNDSLIVTGSSALNCFDRLEVSDFTAKTLIATKSIGTPVSISDKEVEDIKRDFNLK